MGCCASCFKQKKKDYEVIKGEVREGDAGNERGGEEETGREGEGSATESYAWEKEFLQNRVEQSGYYTHAFIVSYPSGTLRGAIPENLLPSQSGIRDIISALQGDTTGLEQRSVAIGGQTPVCTPGKIDDGKAIYCSDGREGGCVAIKTRECLFIVFYSGNTESALTLASELAEFMEENGR